MALALLNWTELQVSTLFIINYDKYIKNHPTEISHTWYKVKDSNGYRCKRCDQIKVTDIDCTYTLGYDCDYAVSIKIMKEALGNE